MSFEIGKNIETGEPLLLNVKDIVASRSYIASETRFGKTHTARRIAEEIFEKWVGQVSVIIVDPDGEYASLREKYSVLIIGRDVPIQVETPTLLADTAEFMAQQILETGTSAIIDLSVVKDFEDGKDYVDKFLRRFFHLQFTAKKPYLVIMETAEDFAPESGAPGTRTCLEISVTLTRRGGKHGIGILFVGHRPAWISKGILSQTPNKAIGRIEYPDMEALERYARIPRSIVEKLVPKTNENGDITDPGPERGVFLFTGDWVQKTAFVKVGPVKTTHLGATPEIIPRPVGDMEAVIANVKKALSEVIEKAKPVVASQIEIQNKIKAELESKYKGKIETLERTAVERAERKYRVKIDELQEQLGKLSRSQALQPTAPITDVLEHPIVKARMLQLDEKARDLLTWIEREPGRTREELAARMVSSKDVVAGLVDKINRVFQLQVVVDDGGRPIRYKSMLKRLFLTDVAKREIEELGRLQERAKAFEEELKTLRPIAQQSATWRGEAQRLTTDNTKLSERLETEKNLYDKNISEAWEKIKELQAQNESLAKENEAYRKIKEGFQALGITAPSVDKEKVKALVEAEIKETLSNIAAASPLDSEKVKAIVEQYTKEFMEHYAEGLPREQGDVRKATLQQTIIETDVEKTVLEGDKFVDNTDKGKIMTLAKEGKLNAWHTATEIWNELLEHHWSVDKSNLSKRLNELIQADYLASKKESNGVAVYVLAPNVKFK